MTNGTSYSTETETETDTDTDTETETETDTDTDTDTETETETEVLDGVCVEQIGEAGFQQVWGSLDILGSGINGTYEYQLSKCLWSQPPPATMKRVERANAILDCMMLMLSLPLSVPVNQTVWGIMQTSVNHMLDFDMHVLSPGTIDAHLEQLDKRNVSILAKLVYSDTIPHRALVQIACPHYLAGGSLPTYIGRSRVAYFSAKAHILANVYRNLSADVGELHAKWALSDTLFNCSGIIHHLARNGVHLTKDGISDDSSAPLLTADHLLERPRKHMQRAILRHIGQRDYNWLLANATSKEDAARLMSAAGQVAGLWLLPPWGAKLATFTNIQWAIALRFKLGMDLFAPGTMCALSAQNGKPCPKAVDPKGYHIFSCGNGPQRLARHDNLNLYLAKWGRAAGYIARLEQVVPEFGVKPRTRDGVVVYEEAVIDVELSMHYCAPSLLLDTTLRSPVADWCVTSAAKTKGYQIAEAIKDKQTRYPPAAGKQVICCAAEIFGNVGKDYLGMMADLAKLASERQIYKGLPPTPWLSMWRYELSVNIARSVADSLLAGGVRFNTLDNALGPPLSTEIGPAPSESLVAPPTPPAQASAGQPAVWQPGQSQLITPPGAQHPASATSQGGGDCCSSPQGNFGASQVANGMAGKNASSAQKPVASSKPGANADMIANVGPCTVAVTQMPQSLRNVSVNQVASACPLSEAMLCAARPGIQKDLLGQQLYMIISVTHPHLANPATVGIITAELLLKPNDFLMRLLRNPSLLDAAVSAAYDAVATSVLEPFVYDPLFDYKAIYSSTENTFVSPIREERLNQPFGVIASNATLHASSTAAETSLGAYNPVDTLQECLNPSLQRC